MTKPLSADLPGELELLASRRRPQGKEFIPILPVAHEMGIKVCVVFTQFPTSLVAKIDLRAKPQTIFLYRRSSISASRGLELDEDHILTPRERFSVAHELGHAVADREFGLFPARERSEYWIQEAWMHRFAAALLTPDSVVDECLRTLDSGEPVPPFCLRDQALKRAKISQEVLATQLCARRSDIGFMKTVLMKRKHDAEQVLRVLFTATGSDLSLPKIHSHISNEGLIGAMIQELVGYGRFKQCRLGKFEPQDLNLAWRFSGNYQTTGASGGSVFWVSASVYRERAESQMSLF